MFLDLEEMVSQEPLVADVCIVGAGAAGISMALALIDSGLTIVLAESGSLTADQAVQDLYQGHVVDEAMHSPTDKYRVRHFGGSTTLWGGRSMPYDRIDLERRDWIENSGWPIDWDDLESYYPEACNLAEVGEYRFSVGSEAPPIIDGFDSPLIRTDGIEKFSCPTNFGARYLRRLQKAENIRVLLNANCTNIQLKEEGAAVEYMEFRGLRQGRVRVRANRFVLAVGGIETARLLLSSNDVQKDGVGNEHDVVGRYYMCHMAGIVGDVRLDKPISAIHHGYFLSDEGIYSRRRFALTEAMQRELRVGNLIARFHFPRISDPAHKSGILSGLYMARNFIGYEYGRRLNDGETPSFSKSAKHLWNVVGDSPETLRFLYNWVRARNLAVRKFPSVIIPNKTNRFTLDVHAEQEPNPLSRIKLGEDSDALGMRRVEVDWQYTKSDVSTVERSLKVMSDEFRRTKVGEVRFDKETLEEELLRFGAYGGHHIGTARMGTDRRTSVVDENCKIHSVKNLYVSGSAVFPTSSQANPTLTIIALSLRLAEHLRVKCGASV